MRTVNFSEARSNLKDVLDRVESDADITIITRRDASDAVVMSLDTFNSWRETLYLLSSPANARHLAKSIAELDAGKGRVRELIKTREDNRVQEVHAAYPSKRVPKRAPARQPARTKKHG